MRRFDSHFLLLFLLLDPLVHFSADFFPVVSLSFKDQILCFPTVPSQWGFFHRAHSGMISYLNMLDIIGIMVKINLVRM